MSAKTLPPPCVSVCVSLCLSVYVCLPCLSVSLCLCPGLSASVFVSAKTPCVSVCVSLCLFLSVCVCLRICICLRVRERVSARVLSLARAEILMCLGASQPGRRPLNPTVAAADPSSSACPAPFVHHHGPGGHWSSSWRKAQKHCKYAATRLHPLHRLPFFPKPFLMARACPPARAPCVRACVRARAGESRRADGGQAGGFCIF